AGSLGGSGGELVFGPGAVVDTSFGTITFASGLAVRTGTASGQINPGANGTALVNNGIISAETPGKSIQINTANPGVFTLINTGVLQGVHGSTILLSSINPVQITNSGKLAFDAGLMRLSAATFTNSICGTVQGTGSFLSSSVD